MTENADKAYIVEEIMCDAMLSSDDNYAQNLISGDGVTEKYKREDLSQVNPQLYKWLAIINDKSSTDNIVSQESDIVNSSVRNDLKNGEKSAIIEKDKEAFSETDEDVSSVSEYTKDMKPMQKGKVEKALNAPYQTKEYGLLTYADFMERSIADGRQLEERRGN